MKKLLRTGVAFAALIAGPAMAADLGAPVYSRPVVVAGPVYNWTGLYVGLNAGGVFSENNSISVVTAPGFVFPGLAFSTPAAITAAAAANGVLGGHSAGFIGGGQIGYNRQLSSAFVAGIEADIQGIASDRSSGNVFNNLQHPTAPGNFLFAQISATNRLDYLGTVRGRFGYLVTPALLAYATGGLAYGGVESSATVNGGLNPPSFITNNVWSGTGSSSSTRAGWAVGGGLEWKFLQNWSAKLEYLYYDLGSVNYSLSPLVVIGLGPVAPFLFVHTPIASTRFDGNIVRVGLNYKFGYAAAPAVYK
jgi:outer membrane immunogenic protein